MGREQISGAESRGVWSSESRTGGRQERAASGGMGSA